MTSKRIRNSTAEFLVFTAGQGEQALDIRYEDDDIWLTQKIMAALFGVDVRTISEHLGNIFKSGELDESAVIRNFRITAADGKNYPTKHYNLDAVISVGYRVNSIRATQFRQWATKVLREFAQKGYVLDHAGKVGSEAAKAHAQSEYDKFRLLQDRQFENDFDKALAAMERQAGEDG